MRLFPIAAISLGLLLLGALPARAGSVYIESYDDAAQTGSYMLRNNTGDQPVVAFGVLHMSGLVAAEVDPVEFPDPAGGGGAAWSSAVLDSAIWAGFPFGVGRTTDSLGPFQDAFGSGFGDIMPAQVAFYFDDDEQQSVMPGGAQGGFQFSAASPGDGALLVYFDGSSSVAPLGVVTDKGTSTGSGGGGGDKGGGGPFPATVPLPRSLWLGIGMLIALCIARRRKSQALPARRTPYD